MPVLKIRIGATLDANLSDIVFAPLVAAATKARGRVKKELDGLTEDLRKAANKAGKGNPYRTNAPGGDDGGLDEMARKRRESHRAIESEEERHAQAMQRTAEAMQRRQERMRERAVERAAGSVVSNLGGVVRRGIGFGVDVARGAGVDFSLGNAVQQRFDLEKRAIELSNSAFQVKGDGEAGSRQDPRQLMREAQAAANAGAVDVGSAMEGMQEFVKVSGDLATARTVLQDLAVLSSATGSNLADIAAAAGNASANLGEVGDGKRFKTVEEKGRAVVSVLRALAGQGKVGAVEMSDLATQIAKIAAGAPMFEGSVEQNMALLGALAQMARQSGGAATATQATTSVQGLVSTLKTPARVKAFKAQGIDVIDEKTKALKNPEEILVQALQKTKGDPVAFKKMFANVTGARTMEGFLALYNQAGGGAAGIKAVRDKFAMLKATSMGEGEIRDSHNVRLQSGDAQTQLLKNQLQKQLGDAIEKVAPQLMELVPAAANAVQALGNLAGWAATNPFQAMTVALGASLAKALGEEMMRAMTARLISGMADKFTYTGLGGLHGNSGMMGAALNTAGAALAITAAAVTIASVGMLAIDKVMEQEKKAKNQVFGDEQSAFAAAANLRMAQRDYDREAERGAPTAETASRLEAARRVAQEAQARLAQRVEEGKQVQKGEGTGFVMASLNSLFGTDFFGGGQNLVQRDAAQESAAQMKQLTSDLSALVMALKGPQKVEVTNMPTGGVPAVGNTGRTGIGG